MFSSCDIRNDDKITWFNNPFSKIKAGLERFFHEGLIGIHHRVRMIRFFSQPESLIGQELYQAKMVF